MKTKKKDLTPNFCQVCGLDGAIALLWGKRVCYKCSWKSKKEIESAKLITEPK